jgi:hypothetical protein
MHAYYPPCALVADEPAPLRRPTVSLTPKGEAVRQFYAFLDALDTLPVDEHRDLTGWAISELCGPRPA